MAATITLDIDLSGWYAKSQRVKEAIGQIPVVEIGPGDEFNKSKAKASFDRADTTYPLSGPAKVKGASLIARTLKAIANGDAANKVRDCMERVGEWCVKDLRTQIRSGAVQGPNRSEWWIRTKGQDINMLGLTGQFVRSLRSRLVRE